MIKNLYYEAHSTSLLISSFNLEMNFLMEALENYHSFNAISEIISYKNKICVAVSGGSDSVALLFMTANYAREKRRKVICVTVDHNLRNESTEEVRFVTKLCNFFGIEHKVLTWYGGKEILKTSLGKLENAARDARYSLIRDFCVSREISIILLGHTLDDQLETFHIRKNSGSSDIGLACMSKIRRLYARSKPNDRDVFLVRPLMQFRKNDLKKFLIDSSIDWRSDPMNDDISFRRVIYRKEIENYNDNEVFTLAKKIKKLGIIRREIETKSVDFLINKNYCQFSEYGYVDILFSEFEKQEEKVQYDILRRVIWDIGGKSYPTSISSDIFKRILSKKINTLGGCLIKIHRNILRITREKRNLDKRKIIYGSGSCIFNNFLVKITNIENEFSYKLIEYVVSCSYDISVQLGLPREICSALPCVYSEDKVVFAYGIEYESCSTLCKIGCNFLHKRDLFDIFL